MRSQKQLFEFREKILILRDNGCLSEAIQYFGEFIKLDEVLSRKYSGRFDLIRNRFNYILHETNQRYLERNIDISETLFKELVKLSEIVFHDEDSVLKRKIVPPIKIFISYAHEDKDWKNAIIGAIEGFRRLGLIDYWHDDEMRIGDWNKQIESKLEEAELILLLISSHFNQSDFCYNIELQAAIRQYEKKISMIMPIIVREGAYSRQPYMKYQAYPTGLVALKKFGEPEPDNEGIIQIALAIEKEVDRLIEEGFID